MIMSEEIKYQSVFGDQSLFDGAPNDAEFAGWFCQEIRWYMIHDDLILFSDGGTWCTSDNPYISSDIAAMRRIIKTPVQHSDDIAVDLFAAKMKEKLKKSRDKGRTGWENCPIEYLVTNLKDHILKGDPVDVANFAMMISQRGESIKAPAWTITDKLRGIDPEIGCDVFVVHTKEIGRIAAINNNNACVVFPDGGFVTVHTKSGITPIETPEERAQRLRSEWVEYALVLYMSSPKNDFASMGDVYDALLSGELQAPKVE